MIDYNKVLIYWTLVSPIYLFSCSFRNVSLQSCTAGLFAQIAIVLARTPVHKPQKIRNVGSDSRLWVVQKRSNTGMEREGGSLRLCAGRKKQQFSFVAF